MKSRTAIALLAVAAALVVFIFLFERDTMTTGEIEGRRDRVFVEFRRDLVDGLTVKGSSGEEVALSRVGPEEGAGEEWRITAPRDLKADGSEVREILSALDFLLRDRTARGEGAASDARYGLDSPRATGSFSVRGRVTAFRVGADAPGDDVYLALVGVDDEVYAVDGSFLESIDKDLDDLRDKHLLGRALDAATAVAVSRPSGEIALSRGEEGSWRVKREGVWLLAAQDQVRDLLRAVGDVEATEFVADDVGAGDLGEHGLDGPPRRVVVELEGGEIVRLLVGGPCEGVEAAVVAAFARTAGRGSRRSRGSRRRGSPRSARRT